jgi:hypothetical protein
VKGNRDVAVTPRKKTTAPARNVKKSLPPSVRSGVSVHLNGGPAAARHVRAGASIEGGLISLTLDGILGWAWDPANPAEPVTAIITSGDVVLGSGVADLYDHDLVRNHVGPGIPGFLIKPTKAPNGRPPIALTLKDEAGRTLGAPLVIDDPARLEPLSLEVERGEYEGYVDQFRDGLLIGWAWSPASPDRPVIVELYEGDDRIDRTVASLYREDLAAAGKRGGHCGFRLELPVALLDDRVHRLEVKIANSRYGLPGGALVFGPLVAASLIKEVAALRAEVARLTSLVERVASPQGEVQTTLVRTVSERIAALAEVQRETVERELDALRAFAFGGTGMEAAPERDRAMQTGLRPRRKAHPSP